MVADYRWAMDNEELRKLAKRRLKAQADFKQFLWIWLGVSVLLLAIWGIVSLTAGHVTYFWPAWPIAGMGVAAFFMGIDAYYGQRVITDADVDAEVERMSRRNGSGTV
jgi:ABC-type phosphate transport system auxiliary subunit